MRNSLHLIVITQLLAVSSLSAATLYVSLESTNPTPPYTNWVTAATNIQDAVNVATAGDVVVVTNGMYPGGVRVNKPLALQGVNGPQFTVINGGGTNQCASLAYSDGCRTPIPIHIGQSFQFKADTCSD
jgi:nitrous oxidase accessory protein NosD